MISEYDLSRVIFGARFLLGVNGENWTKKFLRNNNKYSVDGALRESGHKLGFKESDTEIAYRYLCSMVNEFGYSVPSLAMFNEDPKTTFTNISELLQISIAKLK